MVSKKAATIGQSFCAIVFGGLLLASAGGCAAQVGGTESGGEASQGAEHPAGVEATHAVTEEAREAVPEVTCKPPLVWCACEIGGYIQSWCTTENACLHVCGDRVP